MGAEMRRLRLTKLLLVGALLVAQIVSGACDNESYYQEEISDSRSKRETDGLTTVLLVSARRGNSIPPVGVLTKTARTFVLDGASTEYATQILGTTLDNGRLYAKILSTSSRIFYDKEASPDPSSPYVVYPSKTLEGDWQPTYSLSTSPIKLDKAVDSNNAENLQDSTTHEDLNELKDNDVFNKHDGNEVQFKPAKVRNDNLPTYTVKQDYVAKSVDTTLDDDLPKNYRPRLPKIFRPQQKVSPKKQDTKPLATVTYHGFADFVTTVGDTVIVFSPSTAPAPIARPATTIKGDATLRPDDGIAVIKIRPTSVIFDQRKTGIPQNKNSELNDGHPRKNLNTIENLKVLDLQPSTTGQPEADYSDRLSTPVLLIPNRETGTQNPTGLLKVIDSTATVKGTTTHYMSSIYGTYIGTNYAQIIHTSSNVYFYPEDSTKGYNLNDSDETYDSTSKEALSDSYITLPTDTTDSILTTIKDMLTTEAATENELGNDIIPRNQGRSIQGFSKKNQLLMPNGHKHQDVVNKLSLATRLLPSTIYKTFTYFTTFFSPTNGRTSTSIKSREVINTEITFLTELILPTSTQPSSIGTKKSVNPTNKVEISSNMDSIENTNSPDKQEVEEIQLIFKTIFTTFTYLTTFYDDSTTSISSRKVTATNVITQTIDPINSSIDVDKLVDTEVPTEIIPTKVADLNYANYATKFIETESIKNSDFTTEESTENILSTLPDEITTVEEQTTMEIETDVDKENDDVSIELEPSPILTESTQLLTTQMKTYFTTYTYFTTIIVDDETEIETRTEVFSNIITDTIQPTKTLLPLKNTPTQKQVPPPEILAYLEALKKQKTSEEARLLAQKANEQPYTTTEEGIDMITEDIYLSTTDEATTIDDVVTTEKLANDGEVLSSMKTDVLFSSSSGGSTLLDVADKRISLPEDQELSETNHHDVEPAPTLLLQTSYTTYTYFTTMYNGDATDVVSRLKTVTNVVTETIRPTVVLQPEMKTLQPLTYFTTFTYWTTFIKGDVTDTTSREETVSNVVTPGVADSSSVQLDVIKTYRPFVVATPVHSTPELRESKITSDNEVTSSPKVILKEVPTVKINDLSSTIPPEPMTLYTTYTYFTTSYIGNLTILNSRLETVTSVSFPDDVSLKATPRAIGGGTPSQQLLNAEEKSIQPSKINDVLKTGLLSTIRLSEVNEGTTTHFMTDIYGTYVDGLYAQVVETSTKVELPTPVYSSAVTPVLPTGVLSINVGSIIDADEISTVYYTTKQIGTSINDLYAKIIESSSSTKINDEKLATKLPVHGHRTGLVRLIKGTIEANATTTYYQSKVIGTSIDGRYAQIIESTSSYVFSRPTSNLNIAATSTLPPNHATDLPEISPSPAVIQSSIGEDHTEDILNNDSEQDENENEDEGDDQKSKKKSRLTFSSRKRTSSAPPIRPFASRSRPTFNPKRKPQGATTITRSDITPTITATLAGKGSRFVSSRGRSTPSVGSSVINTSTSRRFSARRSSLPSATSVATNFPSGSSRIRGSVRATPSSTYSVNRRGSSSIRGSSTRPASRGSSLTLSLSSTRYRPGIRPSSTISKILSTVKHDDQEDNANEFATATIVTEEIPITQSDSDGDTIPPTVQTTTESSKRSNNPLLKFRRPPAFGSGVRSTTPRPTTTTTPRRTNNTTRPTANSRVINSRTRPAVPNFNIRTRQSSNLFPPRGLFGKKPDTTEPPVENKNENSEQVEENFDDDPVEEITDNDYEGSEQKEIAPLSNQKNNSTNSVKPVTPIRPFTRINRGRRIRRQTSQSRPMNTRFRRPTVQTTAIEERSDSDIDLSKEEISKTISSNSRYGNRGRSLTTNSRASSSGIKDEKSSEEYIDVLSTPSTRSRSKSNSNRNSLRIKPSNVNSNRQFTLREKESSSAAKTAYKRPASSSRTSNVRTRSNSRPRSNPNRYQDASSSRRSSSRTSSRNGSRSTGRRVVPSRGRLNSYEDNRDLPDFDGTITITHYVPTEVTIPVVNNGVTEKRNIITAQPSTEIIGPDRYSTITNTDGGDLVVLASEMTGTNFQGQLEITRFVIHETPTTKVSHMLTSSGGRRFSQPVVIPSTIFSVENVVSTIRPSLSDNAPLANILLSQLLLGQLGQQNPLTPGALAPAATPSTRYDTRATTYLTTITKHQSTVIPLTFRGKEILTTLVDSSTDVVTATELITDTVVVTPTVALPAANLNSLLLLLQQTQSPQQPNSLLDPLFAVAPLLTQSNTLPGEVERRNQPVDFDYKPESDEDLSEEEIEKVPKAKGKSNASKIQDKAASESSVITLYVSGRRPGEFSTVLSTVKVGEESSSTKVKREISEMTITTSAIPSFQVASESVSYALTGSEEPVDAHAPTQSLESVVGDVGRHISTSIYTCDYEDSNGASIIAQNLQDFGKRRQEFYTEKEKPIEEQEQHTGEHISKKRIRVRVPVIRNRNGKEHAITVVRRRPLVPYTRSTSFQAIDVIPSLTPRKIVAGTRIGNIDTIDNGNNLNDDIYNDLAKNDKHRYTVIRRRKIKPTVIMTKHGNRITRKKLVSIRPVPEPTSTLAIITTGFYTVPFVETNEQNAEFQDIIEPTPDLYTTSSIGNSPNIPLETEKLNTNLDKPELSSHPIIITDNFFLPDILEGSTKNDFKNAIDITTTNLKKIENITNTPIEKEITTEIDIFTSTMNTDDIVDTTLNASVNDNESTTKFENLHLITESNIENRDVNSNQGSNVNETNEYDSFKIISNSSAVSNSSQEMISTVFREDSIQVIPIAVDFKLSTSIQLNTNQTKEILSDSIDTVDYNQAAKTSEIPAVLPLKTEFYTIESSGINKKETDSFFQEQTSVPHLTPEDIEAGLTDDLYLSLSHPDFPQIIPSKVELDETTLSTVDFSEATPELETSIYYSETVVASTRLRTYTYVVTKLNGNETEVTSSTSVRPRVTSLTLTVPVTVTVTPTMVLPPIVLNSSLDDVEDAGRRFNLATRVMSNGVEVIVAGTTPAYRWENSNPQPTLTLSEAVVMLLPQDKPNEFVTKTCMTTFTYLNTITRDGITIVSTDQQVIANTATEERHRKPASEAASVTLEASPTLQTEIFKTTYTYLTLNTDHPNAKNALGSSTRVISNTVTAPQDYLDMILEPSEIQKPETNTYLSTRLFEKTYVGDGKTKIETTNDIITQLIITESALPPRTASIESTPSLSDDTIGLKTDINELSSIKVSPAKSTLPVSTTPEPIQIFATKTYLTTFTYFTTLLQAGNDGETSTIVSSRMHTVENIVTESIAPSLLDPGYMNELLTTSLHSDTLKNIVTGSTIIFFDDEEQITPTSSFQPSASTVADNINDHENTSTLTLADSVGAETNDVTSRPAEHDNNYNKEETVDENTNPPPHKKPSQVSNLLSLGSLGINSLSALGPVITAMAGLLQGKSSATRRNDTETVTEASVTTTQRSPIYIPVGEFVDGDIETAESQNIALHLASNNHLSETRHKVTSSLVDGIPISPGEIITANSDVIIGKPAKMGPRPPQTYLNDGNIGMKPPPKSVPNIPVHPVLEVIKNEPSTKTIKIQKGPQQLEILPAHQIYEEHIKVPIILNQAANSARPQNLYSTVSNVPPKRISSKQDILENDPLLIPPLLIPNVNIDLNNHNNEKNIRPWSQKDPVSPSIISNEEKHQLNFPQKDFYQVENIRQNSGLNLKSPASQPIIHQVPHVIDRSTGQPLLVNIQPSQVANVVIPQAGTQALIFGDTSEPHISGQYFDDPSPYPEQEIEPGFVGIDKTENHQHYSKKYNPADYMTPPSPSTNLKISSISNTGNQFHNIPYSQGHHFNEHSNIAPKSEKISVMRHGIPNLSTGQGHVHSEILVHHGSDREHLRHQNRLTTPAHNYHNVQVLPRRDYTKIHTSQEKNPPRRTEVSLPTQNKFYETVNAPTLNWKNEKKPSQAYWPGSTNRPRLPTRPGIPYSRPVVMDRPVGSIRQPQLAHTQRLPSTNLYQNEFNNYNLHTSTTVPPKDINREIYLSGMHNQMDFKDELSYYQGNYENLQEKRNQSYQNQANYNSADHHFNTDLVINNPSLNKQNNDNTNENEKAFDSEVDASENIKVTSEPQENEAEEALIDETPQNRYEPVIKINYNAHFANNSNNHNSATINKSLNNTTLTSNVFANESGDIILGSEKTHNLYISSAPSKIIENLNNDHNSYIDINDGHSKKIPTISHEIIDLKPPSIIPTFALNGHSRPYSKTYLSLSNTDNKPEVIVDSTNKNYNILQGHMRPGVGQVLHTSIAKNELQNTMQIYTNASHIHSHPGKLKTSNAIGIHPDHPQIITKPKPPVPRPVIVSSGKIRKNNNYERPYIQFSLPIDSIGKENESKTQTERPPNVDSSIIKQKPKEESLDTAFQTNFASTDFIDNEDKEKNIGAGIPNMDLQKAATSKEQLISEDIVPPSISSTDKVKVIVKDQGIDEELRPPPSPTEVVGLSPPPVDITTTSRPIENKLNYSKINSNVSGLKPPPLYIPLKESTITPSLPSQSMIPPNVKSSAARPYLVDILSQDMVPPPIAKKTDRPLEHATVRPGVAVSGSIQITTAVATSHIPVMQDIESKIPIVHGTVDLPVVIDVPDFLKPINTKKADHMSVYTIRPFENKQRKTIKPTPSSTSSLSSATVRQPQINNNLHNSDSYHVLSPTTLSSSQIFKKPSKLPEFSIILEPSNDIYTQSTKTEPTESLSVSIRNNKKTKQKFTNIEIATKTPDIESSQHSKSYSKNTPRLEINNTNLKIKESASKMMEIIGTVVHEFIQNSTNEEMNTKPEEVTRFETLTVTRTETSVLGSPPTTRTLLITRILTSTSIETVTETLLRPTSVISTITSTILQSATHLPAFDNGSDNESIFVVMSDQKPPAEGAEEVEAEYGEEDISRDEQDISGNEIHRVLSGGILGVPSVPIRPPKIQCMPECKASKSEMCAESRGEMRCVCRPGFARMFPDRPCKPTYTFTIGIALDRLGRDRFVYHSGMNDTNSIIFRQFAHPIKEALDRTLMQSDLRDVYRGLNIAKFISDPLRVLFNVQLTSNTDETRLKEVLRKYLVMSNYSLGGTEVYASKELGLIDANDFDECTTEDGGPYHDCSPNAACFNLKGSYQCSCKEGWADLSENPNHPGRRCSQAPLGCAACSNKGHCMINSHGHEVCECFPWHSGQKCQVNLKVLLIAVVTTGTILLGLLAVCVGMACFRNPHRRHTSADRRAMISGNGGDTSSEGSVTELAIPNHVPHILPPPPQMVAPAPPFKKPLRHMNGKQRRAPRKPAPVIAPVARNENCPSNEQRDRSLTVMIPRAKYRSVQQPATPQNYKPMSTFVVNEHKLIDYLDGGMHSANHKPSPTNTSDYKDSDQRVTGQHANFAPNGALVSAGFQVSATVTRPADAESTLARSCGETTVEPATKVIRSTSFPQELDSSLLRSCAETTIRASTKQLMRLDLAEAGSTLARSCGETTIQPSTKLAERAKDCGRDARDSASEGHTMAERDLGSTLRLPAQHAPLYHQDRTSSDRESNFDSL